MLCNGVHFLIQIKYLLQIYNIREDQRPTLAPGDAFLDKEVMPIATYIWILNSFVTETAYYTE